MPAFVLTRFASPYFWASRGVRSELGAQELEVLRHDPDLWPGETSPDHAEARLGGWSGAVFRDDARVIRDDMAEADPANRDRVEAVHTLIAEYEDDPATDPEHLDRWWPGIRLFAYTTAHHERPWRQRPAGPRWRVWLPLSRGASVGEAEELARWIRHPRHDAGMVSPEVERVWRAVAGPAMNPGGYRVHLRDGAAIDVDAALRQLRDWRHQDRVVAARQSLGDGALELAVLGFGRRLSERAAPSLSSSWPGPPPHPAPGAVRPALLPAPVTTFGLEPGGPRPGRISVLMGTPASGRAAFALQVAANQAAAGFPVLYVSTRTGPDELVARLVALRAAGDISAEAILARCADAEGLSAALVALVHDLPTLSFWWPGASDRDAHDLGTRVKAASDLAQGRPPFVVLDSLEAWEGAEEALATALFDAARPETQGRGWPGAEVLALDVAPPDPRWHDAATLARAFDDDPVSLPVREGAVEREASRVLGLRVDTGGAAATATLVVLRDRLGPRRRVSLAFDAPHGRFTPV